MNMFTYTYLLHEHTYMNSRQGHFLISTLFCTYLPWILELDLRGWFICIYCINCLSYSRSRGCFQRDLPFRISLISASERWRLRMSKVVTWFVVSDGTNYPSARCCNSGRDVNLRRIIKLTIYVKRSMQGLTLLPSCCSYRGWGDTLRMFLRV